jgi:hypothetical protein
MQGKWKLTGLLSGAFIFLSGCASSPELNDVSNPTNLEIVEFDGIVNAPIDNAYTNVLDKAQYCWQTGYSGEIEASPPVSIQAPAQIRFVVPGKMVGSRVPLTTVRFFPIASNQTRVVGFSSIFPGTWHLASLESWAETSVPECAPVQGT